MKTILYFVLYCIALAATLPAQPEGAKLMLRKDLGQGRIAEVYSVEVPVDEVYRGPTPEQEEELRKDAERHGGIYRPFPKPERANRTELYVIEDDRRRILWQEIHLYLIMRVDLAHELSGYKVFDVCATPKECLVLLRSKSAVLVGCGRLDNTRTNNESATEWIKTSLIYTTAPIRGKFYSISGAVHVELEDGYGYREVYMRTNGVWGLLRAEPAQAKESSSKSPRASAKANNDLRSADMIRLDLRPESERTNDPRRVVK